VNGAVSSTTAIDLFHVLLPWLPLGVEFAATKRVEPSTLLLFLAIYPVSIGVSSRNQLILGFTIVLGMAYCVFFGMTSGGIVLNSVLITIGYALLGFVVFVHAIERYNRHVPEEELFWKFK
jgi:hypothetical protein